jgi:hypothetical protein
MVKVYVPSVDATVTVAIVAVMVVVMEISNIGQMPQLLLEDNLDAL